MSKSEEHYDRITGNVKSWVLRKVENGSLSPEELEALATEPDEPNASDFSQAWGKGYEQGWAEYQRQQEGE